MAIEQFVKHVEALQQQHHVKVQSFNQSRHANVAHLGNDLVKLKDMLKKAMQQKSAVLR